MREPSELFRKPRHAFECREIAMTRLLALMAAVGAAAGCASGRPDVSGPPPVQTGYVATRADIESADIGPMPADPEPAVRAYMQSLLKDPESARYRFTERPVRSYLWGASARHNAVFAYIYRAEVNAKNSYGAYVGERPYFFYIRHGAVVTHREDSTGYEDYARGLRQ